MQDILGGEQEVKQTKEYSGEVAAHKEVKGEIKNDLERTTVIQDESHRISGVAGMNELEEIKINSVYVKHSKEVNEKNGIRDFYMFDNRGDLVIDGSMGLDEAFEKVKAKLAIRDSTNKTHWLPTTSPPKLQCNIEQTLKQADKLKSYATSCMKWVTSVQQLHLGEDQFLGWICPVKRDLFVLDKGHLSTTSNINMTMEDIIPWKSFGQLKNGFASGNVGMVNPSSGVTTYLAFLRIFVEWCYRVSGSDPSTNIDNSASSLKID